MLVVNYDMWSQCVIIVLSSARKVFGKRVEIIYLSSRFMYQATNLASQACWCDIFYFSDKNYTNALPTSTSQCNKNKDCTSILGEFGQCLYGKCICRRGTARLLNGICKSQSYCGSVCIYGSTYNWMYNTNIL